MRLKTRFRIATAATLGTILVLSGVLGWAHRASSAASANDELAGDLLQASFERGLLRDEYLLLGESRALQQVDHATRRLEALLQVAAVRFEDPADRRVVAEMSALLQRSVTLLEEVLTTSAATPPSVGASGVSAEFRRRAISRQMLISYDLNSQARRLADSASARLDATRRWTTWLLLLILGAVLVVTVVNARVTAGVVERRVARLVEGAEQVAAGNLDHRIAIEGDDELAELGAAFDQMAGRLKASHASLEGEVAERRQAQEQVSTLNEALRRNVAALEVSNRELEAFSYAVSHDLRAPLRSISGFSQAVLEDYGPRLDETGRKYLAMANDGAREMGQLIDDLLSLSRVARIEMARQPVDLSALAGAIVADLRRDEPDRRVEVEIAPGLVGEGDPTLLRLALENLLRNAWKFTSRHPTGRIQVGRAPAPEGDAFFVADDGAGFDMAYAEKLFHPFQRLHRASEFPGTGIGLATVSRVVRRHGGQVAARGAVEQGATFTFTLPRKGASHDEPDHPAGRG